MYQQFNSIVEFLGMISFVMSGSFAAMEKRLDPFGVLIIAFITSVGGGTIRDLLIGVKPFWLTDLWYIYMILGITICSMIFKSIEKNFKVTLFIFDSFGLGLFTIVGIQKAMNTGLDPIICMTMGTITGCCGGILRDILLNRIPLVFRKEIYATACIVGGGMFLLLRAYSHLPYVVVHLFTIFLIVLIRVLAVKYHWQIPKFYVGKNEREI